MQVNTYLKTLAIALVLASSAATAVYANDDDVRDPVPTENRSGGGGGADILVFDIVDAAYDGETRRGGGADIVVFDIIDAAYDGETRRGGGRQVGGDITVFDIVDAANH